MIREERKERGRELLLHRVRAGVSDMVIFEQRSKTGEQTMQQVSKEIMESIYSISNKPSQQFTALMK